VADVVGAGGVTQFAVGGVGEAGLCLRRGGA
jgi:hypothetical protein